jgi:transcriptional regulator with XRE-family HTH domain
MMTEKIRIMLVKKNNMSEAELARRMNLSPQNFNKKMKRDNFKISDLEKIAEALEYKLDVSFFNDIGEEVR